MARILKKIPNFKLPKYKISEIEDLEELKLEYAEKNKELIKGRLERRSDGQEGYPGTNFRTVKEIFEKSTTEFANKTFVLETFTKKRGFEEITYGEFRNDVIEFGTGLEKALKIQPDEKIIIIGETTYEWYVSYMALLCGAGIAVPVDKELPENELENLVKRSKAAAVIYSPKKKDMARKVASRCESVRYCIEMYSSELCAAAAGKEKNAKRAGELYTVGFDFVCSEGKVFVELGDNSLMKREIDPEAFALLIFTSGTTSAAKGVMICNRNLAANINAITPYVDLHPDDRLFSVLPLHHTYESTIGFLYPMAVGASIAVCQGLKHLAGDMQATQPTAILAVPLLIEALHKKIVKNIEKSKKASMVKSMMRLTNGLRNVGIDVKRKVFKDIYAALGGRLRIIVSAAAPLDGRIAKWFEDIGITFLQGYGLTETAPIAALTPDFDTRVGSAGKAVKGDEIRIQNPNERGEGEVLIKGETVMLGYYEDPETTADVIRDGWFNSGDIGYLDEDGFLYITGRSKNVIVTQNGKNIYPEEIETLLSDVPEIAECMVYGKEVSGEKELIITAKVIPDYTAIEELHGSGRKNPDAPFTEDEVYKIIWNQIKQVNRKLTNYKCIKKLEIKTDAFEKTSTMKIKRYAELQKDKEAAEK